MLTVRSAAGARCAWSANKAGKGEQWRLVPSTAQVGVSAEDVCDVLLPPKEVVDEMVNKPRM